MVLEETNCQNSFAPSSNTAFKNIGRTIKNALLKADCESRVVIGLSAAVKMLSKVPDESLVCLLATPKVGDSATHMHEVLLEAFCYENDIYVIKVDCATKLSKIMGIATVESCCLIQKNCNKEDKENETLNKAENIIVDFCEANWDSPTQPVVKLPEV